MTSVSSSTTTNTTTNTTNTTTNTTTVALATADEQPPSLRSSHDNQKHNTPRILVKNSNIDQYNENVIGNNRKGHCSHCCCYRRRSNTRPIMQNVKTTTVATSTRHSSRSAPPFYPTSSHDLTNCLRQNENITDHVNSCKIESLFNGSEEEAAVVVTLDATIKNQFYDSLKEKMRGKVSTSFSLDFSFEKTIGRTGVNGSTNDLLYCPCAIAISYHSSIILVSDLGNDRIQVFTFEWEYITTIPLQAKHLYIEPNFDGMKNDALIISCNDHCIYKYDLMKLIKCSKNGQDCDYIWRVGTPNSKGKGDQLFNLPSGMVCSYGNKKNNFMRLLYVCDCINNRVLVLRASDGKTLETIGEKPEVDYISFKGPWSVDLNDYGELIVCEVDAHRLQTLIKTENGQWASIQTFGIVSGYTSLFSRPRSIVVDKVRNNMIVCDQDNNRIVVLNNTSGNVVKVFGRPGKRMDQFQKPFSICFNVSSGELYVCDFCNHRIQIYK